MKPFVYIASAYTKGDPCVNARFQCKVFDELLGDNIVTPYAPLVSHFQHTMFPRPYQDWVQYDLDIIPRFDACLRLVSLNERDASYHVNESSGADGEVALFTQLNKPVFYIKDHLYAWAKFFKPHPLNPITSMPYLNSNTLRPGRKLEDVCTLADKEAVEKLIRSMAAHEEFAEKATAYAVVRNKITKDYASLITSITKVVDSYEVGKHTAQDAMFELVELLREG